MDYIEEMMILFRGLDRAHGTYEIDESKVAIKKTGRAVTKKEPITRELWEGHISGKKGIGVVPIMDDNKCFFGAIDIDKYENFNPENVIKKVCEHQLPLVPIRSKSGGLHLYLFCSDRVRCDVMQKKLGEFSAAIGVGGSEVFPKQTQILSEKGDVGQWINMPYFNSEDTTRYGYDYDIRPLTLEEFVKFAQEKRITASELKNLRIALMTDIVDGPPCLQHLTSSGFPAGTRNDGLFAMGVYARKAFPDSWTQKLEEYNHRYMKPPLASDEVQALRKSLDKKDYQYPCNKAPIKGHCDSKTCRQRKYGIGQNSGMPVITGITKFDSEPPLWFVDIDEGGRLEMTTEELHSQRKFQMKCMDSLNVFPPTVNRVLWETTIGDLLDNVSVIAAPEDSTNQGRFRELLDRFLSGKARARAMDEVLMNKPYEQDGVYYFKLEGLQNHLQKNNFKDYGRNKIASSLREYGASHRTRSIKGKTVIVWEYHAVEDQESGYQESEFKEDIF